MNEKVRYYYHLGAESTMNFCSMSLFIISPTFLICAAFATELAPNFATLMKSKVVDFY